jgi:hypothetical protein
MRLSSGEKVEQKNSEKSNSCPKCIEVSCTTMLQLKPCQCRDIVDNPSSLCDKCAGEMKLKAAICGNWTCYACHDRHLDECRLCEADEGEGWFMGS